jgi:hypothetical protein
VEIILKSVTDKWVRTFASPTHYGFFNKPYIYDAFERERPLAEGALR